jgi:hypothetical protein
MVSLRDSEAESRFLYQSTGVTSDLSRHCNHGHWHPAESPRIFGGDTPTIDGRPTLLDA